jgi:hypothetical protein
MPPSPVVDAALAKIFPLQRSVDGFIGLLDPAAPNKKTGKGAPVTTDLVDIFPDRAALEAAVAEFLREVRANAKLAEEGAESLLSAER